MENKGREPEEEDIKGGKVQIQQSKGKIITVLQQTFAPIKEIRARNENDEQQRREGEEERREKKYMDIQEEGIESSKQNVALEIKWNQCREDMEEPQDLYRQFFQAIQKQKKSFRQIIAKKEELIKRLEEDIESKDEDYLNLLKRNKEDIRVIINSMHTQYYNMRRIYLDELDLIEDQFMKARAAQIKANKNDIKIWIGKHEDSERQFINNRWNNEKEQEKEINDLRIKNSQDYVLLKKQIETDIQNLQQCQEDMRALYQLNEEKLDYNLSVLTAKARENTKLQLDLKAQQNSLREKYGRLFAKFETTDHRFKKQNKQLTDDFRRVTLQFKELQRKFKHFKKQDLEQYEKVEAMKLAEIQKLQEKIKKADKIIHIQQLGRQWNPNWQQEQEFMVSQTSKVDLNVSKNTSIKGGMSASGEQADGQSKLKISDENTLTEILDLLIDECEFVVEEQRDEEHQKDWDNQPEYLKTAEKLKIIKKAFKIESMEEFDELINTIEAAMTKVEEEKYLEDELVESKDLEGEAEDKDKKDEEEEEDEEDFMKEKDVGKDRDQQLEQERIRLDSLETVKLKYDPDAIQEAITTFVKNDYLRKDKLAKKYKLKKQDDDERESKEKQAEMRRQIWDNYTKVLPEETFRIWGVLDKALYNYYRLLQERQQAIDETSRLHDENEEYKNLLNQYLQINHELIIPPTEMIKINPTSQI